LRGHPVIIVVHPVVVLLFLEVEIIVHLIILHEVVIHTIGNIISNTFLKVIDLLCFHPAIF
jgi:hypothetical protein